MGRPLMNYAPQCDRSRPPCCFTFGLSWLPHVQHQLGFDYRLDDLNALAQLSGLKELSLDGKANDPVATRT